jgi:DNA-binding CsgD family transcriptional regulator
LTASAPWVHHPTTNVYGGSTEIVGRDVELEQLRAFIDRDHGAQVLWLEGVAGIGKTTLWRAATDAARDLGWRVLACRPTASEAAFSFAALGDLLTPDVAEVLAGLPAPQRSAIEAALALVDGEPRNLDERTVGLAVLSWLRVLAAADPVLVAIDDVQWLDRASASTLRFAARRLTHEQVKLCLTVRLEPGAPSVEFERDLSGRLLKVHVGSLSSSDLHRIVVARFGQALPRHTLLRLHAASAGNPLFAIEIARAMLEGALAAAPGDPLPVPPAVDELLRARVERLPRRVRGLLEVVALLSEPTLGKLEGEPELEHVDGAAAAGVVEVVEDRIRFVHPLLASAVVSTIGPRRRRRLHARLAGLELDLEERARHLALAGEGRHAVTADLLERAAQHAALRGASSAAAELAELAAQRTPLDDQESRWRRTIEAGCRHGAAGDFARARAVLEPLLDEIPPGPERARVLLNLAEVRWGDAREMVALAERALAEVGSDDAYRARIHALLGSWVTDSASRVAHHQAGLEAAERSGDDELTVLAMVDLLSEEVAAGQTTPGLLDRALALADRTRGRMLPRVPYFEHPGQALGLTLTRLDRFDDARPLLERASADSLEQGAYPAAAFAAMALCELGCRLGDWATAAQHASQLEELTDQLGLEGASPFALYARARVHAYLGHVDEARAFACRGVEISGQAGVFGYVALNQGVLGFLELSLGDVAAAVRYLRPAARWLDECGWREPGTDLKPNAIEALVSAGELEEAAELLADLQDWSRCLDAVATGAVCSRCQGLLCAARGDPAGAFAAFEEGLAALRRLPTPFEHGRTLLALGSLQRRRKRKAAARESLSAACATFEALGAPLWAAKATTELGQLGGRRPQDGRLTPTEHRIASLVAQGRTNQQVADELFVSPKTVEWNLSKIYRKLQVRSRAELTAKRAQSLRGIPPS